MEHNTYTAFAGSERIVTADLAGALTAVKAALERESGAGVLVFDDETGKQVDFDLRGSVDDVIARALPPKPKPGPGRPSLGVKAMEVTLLPRHWEWLERKDRNVSAALRRVVEAAMKSESPEDRAKDRIEAADRELWVLAGNLEDCEEASRALYARDFKRFKSIARKWPRDVGEHLVALALRADGVSNI